MSTEAELAQLIGKPGRPADNAPGPRAEAGWPHLCDVFVVDDTGGSRELLSAILRNFAGGLVIREARNGVEAANLWLQINPRITLLDIDMPGLDGLAVLKQVRALRSSAFVAMISGGSSIDTVRKALALGANGFVIKPYKPQRILDLLHKYREVSGVDILKL
jgi:two-component system chemotaxis response regulator CheY